jgi:CheY-like chemotaxis protein
MEKGGYREPPAKILVVDDEVQVQLLLEEFLTSLGHTVRIVGDGRQPLRLLQIEAFDGVFVDLKMAKMGSMELLGRIKLS